MKKAKKVMLPNVKTSDLVKSLKRNLGEDRALKVADNTVKNLSTIGVGDVNADIFSQKEILKSLRVWTEVKNLLSK